MLFALKARLGRVSLCGTAAQQELCPTAGTSTAIGCTASPITMRADLDLAAEDPVDGGGVRQHEGDAEDGDETHDPQRPLG